MSNPLKFPYGNDLRRPQDWVGSPETKSKKYLAAYVGGNAFSFVWDAHAVIFFGVESLSIGIFELQSLGAQAGMGPGKVVKFAKRVEERLDVALDYMGRAKKITDKMTLDSIGDPEQLYKMMEGNASIIEADEPFSMNDLKGKWGTIYGGEIETYGNASVYYISAGYSFKDSDEYISYEQIYNLGSGGLIGLNATAAGGKWVDRRIFSAYEYQSGAVDADDRPFAGYGGAIQYLRMLPAPQYEVPEYVVKAGEEYARTGRY